MTFPEDTTPSPSQRADYQRTILNQAQIRSKTKRRRGLGCLTAFLIVVALGVGAYFTLQGPISNFVSSLQHEDYVGSGTGEVKFTINQGDSGEDIAKNLVKADIVKSYEVFYKLLLAKNPAPKFEPSQIRMASKMSAKDALGRLIDPAYKIESDLLITEGQDIGDAFEAIAKAIGVSVDEVKSAASDPQAFGLPVEAKSVEGFLFPATYKFSTELTAKEVIQRLVNRCFQALDSAGVAKDKRWSAIVFASLVQRESGLREDYYKVARVFLNRLDPAQWSSGLLQSDATVAYGTGNTHRVTTTDAERADASNIYNTYVHPGMVVAPISNPGDLAIDAVLHPAPGDWLFFVTWNLKTGETVFSKTVEEHDAGVAKWQQWMSENPDYK